MDLEDGEGVEAELRALLAARERDLELAASLGKALLDSNRELAEAHEAAVAECALRVADLEQEVHTHKLRADAAQKAASIVRADAEREISSLSSRCAELSARVAEFERTASSSADTHASAVVRLQDELTAARNSERQLQARVLQQFDLIATLQKELAERPAGEGERADSGAVTAALSERLATLEDALCTARDAAIRAEQASAALATARDEALEARAHTARLLDEAREEIEELRMLHGAARAELEDARSGTTGRVAEGTTLFSEVEDRRLELERRLVALTAQHAASKRAADVQRRLVQSLRAQIAGLLRMGGSRADAEHCRRLEQALAQSTAESARLAERLATMEGGGSAPSAAGAEARRMREYRGAFGHGGGASDRDAYIECLEGAARAAESALEQCRAELHTARLTRAAESAKVREAEQALYRCEMQRDQLHADVAALQLRLEEARAQVAEAETAARAADPLPEGSAAGARSAPAANAARRPLCDANALPPVQAPQSTPAANKAEAASNVPQQATAAAGVSAAVGETRYKENTQPGVIRIRHGAQKKSDECVQQ